MKVEKNKVVAISYTLHVDGAIADQMKEDKPLDFIYGIGSLLPKFEEYLLGKEPGDSFEFVLSPEEGYGEYNDKNILDLPIDIFKVDGKVDESILVPGNILPMMNNNGGIIPGKVVEVKDNVVVMDFNHQMAGKTLNFEGKVLTVRDATETELRDGLHGEFKQSCSGCGSGGCGDGECCGGCGC